ncbi:MAG: GIY-YIG nuclease family protein [Cyanobacteria bacterium J06638_20]
MVDILTPFPLADAKAFAPKDPGIYCIECSTTSKRYVGRASSLQERLVGHYSALSKGKHHAKAMQRDYQGFGVQRFQAFVCETTSVQNSACFYHVIKEWEWTERIKPEYGGARFSPEKQLENAYGSVITELRLACKRYLRFCSMPDEARVTVRQLIEFLDSYPSALRLWKLEDVINTRYAEKVVKAECRFKFRSAPYYDLIEFVLDYKGSSIRTDEDRQIFEVMKEAFI